MSEIVQSVDSEELETDGWVYLGEFYGTRGSSPSGKNQTLPKPSKYKEVLFITKQSQNRYASQQIAPDGPNLVTGYYLPYGPAEEVRVVFYVVGGSGDFQIYNGPYKGTTNMETSQEANDLVTKVYVKY